MTSESARRRPRPGSLWSGAFCVRSALLALAVSAGASVVGAATSHALDAQVPDTVPPPRPDTIPPPPPDTLPPERGDTLPPEPEPEPEPPAPLPTLGPVGPTGWAAGVWEWGRDDLLRLPDVSLLHLLERIPGITGVRASHVGQPEAAAVFGVAGGGVTYEIDGFVMDPLTAPTVDPGRIPLLSLERVRVERRLTGATVRIRTRSPEDPRAYSLIEAGTGDLRTNLFRGTFLAPRVLGGALALGFESLGSQTLAGGTSNHLAGWLKWTWVHDDGGVQVAYRQSDLSRTGVGAGLSSMRRDWTVRGRQALGPVTAEAYAGASSVEDRIGDLVLNEGAPQGGVRLASALPAPVPTEATLSVRLRSHPALPAQELEVAAWTAPAPWLVLGADVVHGRWAEGSPTGRWTARARAGPVAGLTAFAELGRADRAVVGTGTEPAAPGPARIELASGGQRFGLALQRWGVSAGASAIMVSADSVAGFGREFDPAAPRFEAGVARGFEVSLGIPTGWRPLGLEGWYVGMDVPGTWVYFPAQQGRAALVYHDLPLPSGNLEIFARVEHELRGGMAVPAGDAAGAVGPYQATNLELTIRVLTVRAFLRWQNVLHRVGQHDLPGFERPGQHVLYGVKWEFWN